MRIVINTSTLRFGGAVQVALSFIKACREFSQHEYHVFVGRGLKKSIDEKEFGNNFYFYSVDFGIVRLNEIYKRARILSNLENKIRPDVVITTSGPSYWKSKAPQLMGFNLPLYIYPESPHVQEMPFKRKLLLYLKKKLHYYFFKRDADAFIVQTDDVNQRVKKEFPSKNVFTVSNTHNQFYINPKKCHLKLTEKAKDEIRAITISSFYPHKNLDIIPHIIKELNIIGMNNIKFILTLDSLTFQKIFPNPDDNIVNVGPLKPDECPSLYKECDFLFLPTLAECFSASYPEAMVMEKPIITTDLGFSRSICNDAALYFKPKNAKDGAEKIKVLVNDNELWNQLILKGRVRVKEFPSPEERAQQILNICKLLVLKNVK